MPIIKTQQYRGFNIEVYENFSWKVKRVDGTIVEEPDNMYLFDGEDLEDAIVQAKDAINDHLDA